MRKILNPIAVLSVAILSVLAISCKKDAKAPVQDQAISADVLAKIHNLGFSSNNVQKHAQGYLVEGDIVITQEQLDQKPEMQFLRIAGEEQYRTYNLVGALPRTIYIRVSTSLSSTYVSATDEAINRYNAENLLLRFQRVTSGGNILISPAPSGATYLASAGFPSGGNPYNSVLVNTSALVGQPLNTIASVLAHEVGHCIGFRHTDWMNRSYSCGGSAVNEGSGTVGAVLIPGTPSGPDAGSWMLACIGSGQNRPFNSNDRIALNYLY
jgi:hypothetical protein